MPENWVWVMTSPYVHPLHVSQMRHPRCGQPAFSARKQNEKATREQTYGALSICMEKPVRIFWQMEQYRFLRFWDNKPHICMWFNSCSSGSNGSSVMRQMVQWCSGHFGKIEKSGLHLKVFLYFRDISTGKDCFICCPTRTTGISMQKESVHVLLSLEVLFFERL